MNARELLCRSINRGLKDLFVAARALPADRLAWQPTPASRSALSQLQECATILGFMGDALDTREIKFSPDSFEKWKEERAKITSIDELETVALANAKALCEKIMTLTDAELEEPVKNPWDAEMLVCDALVYHAWNYGYHEGQINYIAGLIEGEAKS